MSHNNLYMPLAQNEDPFENSEEDPEEEYVSFLGWGSLNKFHINIYKI
jgi:hypothetical protein